jgi:hypothetical protein
MLPTEAMYIGVDIGKFKHVAGFVSKTLLERHQHFENCPAFTFEQSREGFRALVDRTGREKWVILRMSRERLSCYPFNQKLSL